MGTGTGQPISTQPLLELGAAPGGVPHNLRVCCCSIIVVHMFSLHMLSCVTFLPGGVTAAPYHPDDMQPRKNIMCILAAAFLLLQGLTTSDGGPAAAAALKGGWQQQLSPLQCGPRCCCCLLWGACRPQRMGTSTGHDGTARMTAQIR